MFSIDVDTRPVDRMVLRLRGTTEQLRRPVGIMRTVAEGVEHQTRVRIEHEKRAPNGRPWRPWSKRYAKTRKRGVHSLLMDTWAMVRDGLDSDSGVNWAKVFIRRKVAPYAAIHQRQRPMLGLSSRNARDMERWLARSLQQLAAENLKGVRAQ